MTLLHLPGDALPRTLFLLAAALGTHGVVGRSRPVLQHLALAGGLPCVWHCRSWSRGLPGGWFPCRG